MTCCHRQRNSQEPVMKRQTSVWEFRALIVSTFTPIGVSRLSLHFPLSATTACSSAQSLFTLTGQQANEFFVMRSVCEFPARELQLRPRGHPLPGGARAAGRRGPGLAPLAAVKDTDTLWSRRWESVTLWFPSETSYCRRTGSHFGYLPCNLFNTGEGGWNFF